METYPVDTDPEQIVRWLLVERERGTTSLDVVASRINELESFADQPQLPLGDEDRDDLSEQVTVAMLEIMPRHAAHEWRLTISVEEDLTPSESDNEDEEEEIDLDAFYLEFIRPGRGTVNVMAEAEDADAEADLNRLLAAIETNIHVPDGSIRNQRSLC
ncbi:hypothetical protein SAMN02745126_05744 [Enhydrobacter aerosaccus]|uniref:Uncharacterized protein n=1 Tax=Enhydrobacter aerosaccus TaxID=225324 RepID=A0A1T4T5W9_9HYPH|nr:hypothetical protein [Enhydrobacter aerosaccus]SKA35904.1 hypothetical protein SAMN02745126_05744 [Enhydrobacter aerosaccus]